MDKEKFLEEFNRQQHRLGRIMLISAALLLLAVPFMLGAIYGAFPDFKGFINGLWDMNLRWIKWKSGNAIICLQKNFPLFTLRRHWNIAMKR